MICLQQNPTTGAYEPVSPQPADITGCGMVLPSYSDISSPVWNLSAADGALISGAIVGVWGLAWTGKALYRTVFGMVSND